MASEEPKRTAATRTPNGPAMHTALVVVVIVAIVIITLLTITAIWNGPPIVSSASSHPFGYVLRIL